MAKSNLGNLFGDRAPMAIYQTLDMFQEATGLKMGTGDSVPLAQGYPYLSQIEDGVELDESVTLFDGDRKYPDRWGVSEFRDVIAKYYRDVHGCSNIGPEHVMVLRGGRDVIDLAIRLWANHLIDNRIEPTMAIEQTEYTPMWDTLLFNRVKSVLVPSSLENHFYPETSVFMDVLGKGVHGWYKSRPNNPTGVVWTLDQMRPLIEATREADVFGMVDEAYEFHTDPDFRSTVSIVDNIDDYNLVVLGAATKALQFPGARIGWAIGPQRFIESLGAAMTFVGGGVSVPSQRAIEAMFVKVAARRDAMGRFNREINNFYGGVLEECGFKLHTGTGGFYHWAEAPVELDPKKVNSMLYPYNTSFLAGVYCDMGRPSTKDKKVWDAYQSPLARMFRLSHGPRGREHLEHDREMLLKALKTNV